MWYFRLQQCLDKHVDMFLLTFSKNNSKNENSSLSELRLVVTWSEVCLSLSLHGSLHLFQHPQRNWERFQLIHSDVRTVPVGACTHSHHYGNQMPGQIMWNQAVMSLTCTHHCVTNPGCPPRSASRPEQPHIRNMSTAVQVESTSTAHVILLHEYHVLFRSTNAMSSDWRQLLSSPSSLLLLSCDVSLPTTVYPLHLQRTDTHIFTVKHTLSGEMTTDTCWLSSFKFTLNRSACLM